MAENDARSVLDTAKPTSLTILALLPILLAIYILTTAFYNLYLHPLSSHPGPLLGRLTKLSDVYHAYRGDKHIHLYHLHARYGPVVRFSPNSLSINDPSALKAIYGHGANVQKSETFYHAFRAHPAAVSTLLATERVQHARKRRIMGQAFSETAMRGMERYVLENVEVWLGGIRERVEAAKGEGRKWSERVDMGRWNNYLVFDIMGDLVFGKSFGTLAANPENRNAIRLLGRAARRNYTVGAMPFLHRSGLERWMPPFRALFLDRLQYLAFGKRQVVERSQNTSLDDSGRKDIFHYLLGAKDPDTGEGMPQSELYMESNTLIVAGSDTSSTTLSATLYYLLRNTACLEQVTTEIRSTFIEKEDIRTGPKLQSCYHLRACIDEAMRMSPAVPGLLPRLVLPGGLDIPAMNLHIPAGVDVGTCTYAIQHHEDYVVEPFKYDPSRWLQQADSKSQVSHVRQRSDSGVALSNPLATKDGTKSKEYAVLHHDRETLNSVSAPFSLGNRACLGKPLVYMEISTAIARLVFAHDMRLVEAGSKDASVRADVVSGKRIASEYHLRDWFLGKNEGPIVEFAGRQDA